MKIKDYNINDLLVELETCKNLRDFLKEQIFYKKVNSENMAYQRICILYTLLYVLKDLKPMEPEEEYNYISDIGELLHEVKTIAWQERKWKLNTDRALELCVGIIEKYIEDVWILEPERVKYNERNDEKIIQKMDTKIILNQSRIDPNLKISVLRQIIAKYSDERLNDIDYLFKKQA